MLRTVDSERHKLWLPCCYRYVLSRPEVDACMTGPSNGARMVEAFEALQRGPMTEEELARCSAWSAW
jgi:predicted aldo/keto reductase-like oxidoreductase